MSVTNPDKVVTKQDLADFYEGIFPYLGGMPEVLANKFSKGDLYSTDEKMIGQWIDGKPLYQKTVNFGVLPNSTTKAVAHGISNLDKVYNIYGIAIGNNLYQPLPQVNDAAPNKSISIWADGTNISVRATNVDFSTSNGYITLQYTKTTDSAISIGSDTDYSTEEKIVGTWIDGRPLYQKSIAVTLPDNIIEGTFSRSNFSIGANVDICFIIDGYIYNDNGSIFTINSVVDNTTYILTTVGNYHHPISPNTLFVGSSKESLANKSGFVTLQYTKTT